MVTFATPAAIKMADADAQAMIGVFVNFVASPRLLIARFAKNMVTPAKAKIKA